MGYHTREIDKGEYGEVSKIREEWEEFLDAHQQGARVLELCELADMYGAMAGYVEKHFPGTTMFDVILMADMTRSAFKEGSRK
jgi:hypothetical protein